MRHIAINSDKIISNLFSNIYWLDKDNNFLGCNDQQAQTLGFHSSKEIVGKNIFDFGGNKNKKYMEIIAKINKEVMLTEKMITAEEKYITQAGKELTFLSHKSPLKNSKGEVIGVVGVSFDISEIKQMQDKIMEENINMRIALENVIRTLPGHVYWKDKDGIYLGCNEQQAKSLGYSSPKEVIGKTDRDLSPAWQAELYEKVDREILISGQAKVAEETAILKDGDKAHFLSEKKPLLDKNGSIVGIIGVSFNITEKKKTEEELIKAKEAAEAANKATTAFLENMRHDLRTALSGIEGHAQLIRDEAENKKIKEYADNLFISSRTLTFVINQILNATRVFAGDMPLYRKKFDIQSKLKQIVNLNLAKAHSKKLKFNYKHDKKIPRYLIGDCKRISIIALELVTNALKYTEKGEVHIETKLHRQKDDGKIVLKLVVSDTGIGIPVERQEEIFMRFNRLTPAYEGKYKGLGLGLSVIKQFIDELSGEIYISSRPNEGTAFTCYFPLTEALSDNEEGLDESGDLFGDVDAMDMDYVLPKQKRIDTASKEDAGKSRILVVEDQPIAAQVASGILSNLNCIVDVAENGQEAIEKASANQYDLIFMDVGLPDMDGNAVTRRIRLMERETNAHVPIVALTAHVDSGRKQQCVEAGMDAVLNKPLVKERAADMLSAFIPSRSKTLEKPAEESNEENTEAQTSHLFELEGVVIDLEQGADLVAADEDMAKSMLEMMLKNFNEEKTDLVESHKAKDWEKVKDIVHKLRGGMAYCGTPRLHQAGLHLEDYLKTEQTDLAEKLYEQFISEVEKVKTEFEALE